MSAFFPVAFGRLQPCLSPLKRQNNALYAGIAPGLTLVLAGCAGAPAASTGADPFPQAPIAIAAQNPPKEVEVDPADALTKQIEAYAAELQGGRGTVPVLEPQPQLDASATSEPISSTQPVPGVAEPQIKIASSEVLPLSAPVPEPIPAPSQPSRVVPIKTVEATTDEIVREVPVPETTSLSSRLRDRMQDDPGSLASVLDYELLRLIEDEPGDPQLAAAGGDTVGTGDLSQEDARILGTLRDGLRNFRQTLDTDTTNPLPAEKIRPLVDMAEELQRQVGLTLPTVVLCSEVQMFANYEPMATTFSVGQVRRAVLYVEVDHFASRKQPDAWYETEMTLGATLYDPEGNPVLEVPEGEAIDRSRQKRRDFYMVRILTLPAIPEAGEYTLKVTVVDKLSGRIAQQGLTLTYE